MTAIEKFLADVVGVISETTSIPTGNYDLLSVYATRPALMLGNDLHPDREL